MNDEYIRDIADVIEKDVDPNQTHIEVDDDDIEFKKGAKKPKGYGAIMTGLTGSRADRFRHIEEEMFGPSKNTMVEDVDEEERAMAEN